MKLLFVGDIVGEPGRTMLKDLLPGIIADNNINFTVANGENAAGGRGLTRNTADEIFSYGVNVLTMGNHTFD
ncbi:MAG: YmdB family metallophosphoesterase, partial [Elusimicrobia bacterium]|nr:YmdB family metallophosphoesterase [Elusimicrobiota bacterium]